MKKEYLFFLVMVLAAAVITGATIGFISNFHYIVNQSPASTSQAEPVQQDTAASNPDRQNDVLKSQPVEPGDIGDKNTDSQGRKVAVVKSPTPTSEQGYLILSREEKQQVINMLVSLGANKGGDYSEFIRNFQKEKSLPPTGSLDSLTLNAIILEVTRQRATQMVNG
ncbi:peptidoglycan-binding domain-containing protein [Syntrophomonas curvata]